MITTDELLDLNNVEGDVLFLVNKNAEFPTEFINLYEPGHPYINRSYDFVIDPFSKNYNKMFDLSNRIKNNMVRPSTIVKQKFDNLNELSGKYALVYIDADDNQVGNILSGIDKNLLDKAFIICKSVDFPTFFDYITKYNNILPNITDDGYVKWYRKRVLGLNKKVYRDFSNNF